ncbi:transglutaminase-like domain-containing protein, partial [Endozoicomonas sp. SESOKO2]|uniref:transglutaminase-like domain-containing protein n=1 Tax=Endozoicomonas sp. SESOKO2 TaxID=2828743 RepID=UPI0021482605
EGSKHFDNRCSEGMKTVLNKLFETFDHDDQHPAEVKMLLQAIRKPKGTEDRIKAITEYCKQFSGEAQPGRHENFFEFLVTKRQGSCRHRVPAFIAFCRYFGIPSREIKNAIHSFAEYSVDGGQTWEPVDLGGAPFEETEITFHFQPIRKLTGSSSESRKINALLKALLKGADLAEQQTLARACGMSLMELNKSLEKNSALPETNLNILEMVHNLWKENNLVSFHMAVSTLESLGKKALVNQEIGTKYMSLAVRQILSDSDGYLIIELLKSLHSKIIDQAGVKAAYQWLIAMVFILQEIDLTQPSVIRFVLEAMELGWLEPVSNPIMKPDKHHHLLVRLKGVDELKVKAADCLKNWYKKVFSRKKNSYVCRLVYRKFQEGGGTLFVTHCHNGFSQFFEDKIVNRSLRIVWTDEPEGTPNIERMLVRQPAFPKLVSGKTNHLPVIIMGQPSWDKTVMNKKTGVLFQRHLENKPDLKPLLEKIKPNSSEVSWEDQQLLNALRDKQRLALQQAFCHYLYEMTHSKGGCLTYCWSDATIRSEVELTDSYGAHDPSSVEQLYAMMSSIDSSCWFQECGHDAFLRQALYADNALVLKSDELTKIAEEFCNSVNLNSLFESLDT